MDDFQWLPCDGGLWWVVPNASGDKEKSEWIERMHKGFREDFLGVNNKNGDTPHAHAPTTLCANEKGTEMHLIPPFSVYVQNVRRWCILFFLPLPLHQMQLTSLCAVQILLLASFN